MSEQSVFFHHPESVSWPGLTFYSIFRSERKRFGAEEGVARLEIHRLWRNWADGSHRRHVQRHIRRHSHGGHRLLRQGGHAVLHSAQGRKIQNNSCRSWWYVTKNEI